MNATFATTMGDPRNGLALPVSLVWGLALLAGGSVQAQVMGASSSSTGLFTLPVTTTSVGSTTYGSRNLNVINQAGGPVVPSFTFNIPTIPKPILPEQPIQAPKPFEPSLGPFEANR